MDLNDFVTESNRIEGIDRLALPREIEAHEHFLKLEDITVPDLEWFVDAVQPGARLRTSPGMDVRVGSHIAPPGGPAVREDLAHLLTLPKLWTPFELHCEYEKHHPFMDGDGRSGWVLWLWMMGGKAPLGFLHQFYYQTLQASR